MKKKVGLIALLVIALLIGFMGLKLVTNRSTSVKSTLEINIYTLSQSDTEKWEKVEKVTTETATYLLNVQQETSAENIFKHLIDEGETSIGVGISEESVSLYNQTLDDDVLNSKNNRLIGIDYFNFSSEDTGFVTAEFDYGDETFNKQKTQTKQFLKQLYEASLVN